MGSSTPQARLCQVVRLAEGCPPFTLSPHATLYGSLGGGWPSGSGEAFAVPRQKLFFLVSASKGSILMVFRGEMGFRDREKAEMGHFRISYWVGGAWGVTEMRRR